MPVGHYLSMVLMFLTIHAINRVAMLDGPHYHHSFSGFRDKSRGYWGE
jgi:hypothetical protein